MDQPLTSIEVPASQVLDKWIESSLAIDGLSWESIDELAGKLGLSLASTPAQSAEFYTRLLKVIVVIANASTKMLGDIPVDSILFQETVTSVDFRECTVSLEEISDRMQALDSSYGS